MVTFLIIFFWQKGTIEDDKLSRPINVSPTINSSTSLRKNGGVRNAYDVTNNHGYTKDDNDDYDYDDEESTSESKDIRNNYGYTKDGNDEDDYDDEESTSEGKDVTNNYGYTKDGNDEDDYDDEESTFEGKNITNVYGDTKDSNSNNDDEESISEDGSVNKKKNLDYLVEDEDDGSSKKKKMDDGYQDNSIDHDDIDAQYELFKKYYLNNDDDNDDNMSVEENTNFLDFSFDTDEGDIGEMDGSADVGEDDQDINLQKLIKYYRSDEILSDNDENNGEGFLLDMDGGDDENDGSSNVGDAGLAW